MNMPDFSTNLHANDQDYLDLEAIEKALEDYFINNPEVEEKFSPVSENRIKKPGVNMRKILEKSGADFVSPPTLEECEYRFTIVTRYGSEFTTAYFRIDYWNCCVHVNDYFEF